MGCCKSFDKDKNSVSFQVTLEVKDNSKGNENQKNKFSQSHSKEIYISINQEDDQNQHQK